MLQLVLRMFFANWFWDFPRPPVSRANSFSISRGFDNSQVSLSDGFLIPRRPDLMMGSRGSHQYQRAMSHFPLYGAFLPCQRAASLSCKVSISSSAMAISYVPEFSAETESALRPLPRTFAIQSLSDFAAGLEEDLLLCPVRSLSEYLRRTSRLELRLRRLFVSPRCPSRTMSKNGISYFLREVIVHSGASSGDGAAPRAHSIRGIATPSAFFKLVIVEGMGGCLMEFQHGFYFFLLKSRSIFV